MEERERVVAVYARVSDAESAAESSVPDQLREGEAFARAQWPAAGFVSFSEVQSAATIAKRPEFCRLLALANAGRVAAVVVRDQDRLSRDAAEMLALHRHLSDKNVEVWLYRNRERLKADGPTDKLLLGVMALVSQFEREIGAVRVKARMVSMRNEGKWTGGPVPCGYDLVNDERGKRLQPNADAPKVVEVFKIAAETHSLALAFAYAQEHGLWKHKQGVSHALRNRIYLGEHRNAGAWIPNVYPPLVTPALFEAAQQTAGLPYLTKKKVERVMQLEGLLWCSEHGKHLGATHTRKGALRYFYYRCPVKGCGLTHIPADALEAWAWGELGQLCQDPKLLTAALDHHEAVYRRGNRPALARVAELEERLKVLQRQADTLLDLVCAGARDGAPLNERTKTEVLQRLDAIGDAKAPVERDLAAARLQAHPTEKLDAELFLRALRAALAEEGSNPKMRRAAFRALVQRIELAGDDAHFVLAEPNRALLPAACAGIEFGSREEWWAIQDSNL